MLWLIAHWQVTGHAFRKDMLDRLRGRRGLVYGLLSILPAATYAALRYAAEQVQAQSPMLVSFLCLHYLASVAGLSLYLLLPSGEEALWKLTAVPLRTRAIRYSFWAVLLSWKFALGLISIAAIRTAIVKLNMTLPGAESPSDFINILRSIDSTADMMLWLFIMGDQLLVVCCGYATLVRSLLHSSWCGNCFCAEEVSLLTICLRGCCLEDSREVF
jgi:hypothetical protein